MKKKAKGAKKTTKMVKKAPKKMAKKPAAKMKVSPVPQGFHTVTPHLILKNSRAAIDFYKKAFGAKEVMCMMGPDGQSVMHAEIKIGDSHVFLADEFPQMGAVGPQTLGGAGVTVHMYLKNVDKVFESAVAAGAQVLMPVTDMFWGDRYGQVKDPFGHVWSLASRIKNMTQKQMAKAGMEAMSQMDNGPPGEPSGGMSSPESSGSM